MKICMAQIEVIPCRPDLNYVTMTNAVVKAKSQKADMIIFPELCIPGYLIGDTWEEEAFLNDCLSYGNQIRNMADGIVIVFGNISIDRTKTNNDGRIRKYNSLYCARDKKFVSFASNIGFGGFDNYGKILLPYYREFDEPRHFVSRGKSSGYPGAEKSILSLTPTKILGTYMGLCICEDGWDKDYELKPIKTYSDEGAELIINISGSPFTTGKNGSRNKTFGEGHAKANSIPLIYVNCVGIQNNGKDVFTFDGSSVAYNSNGEIVAHAPMFEECLLYVYYDHGDLLPGNIAPMPQTEIEEIEKAIVYGATKFLQVCETNKIVIGLSGGIDSAVAAVIYSRIVGPENLLLVNMPSKYNSKTTINISEQIAKNIGCYYTSIGIEESVNLTIEQIQNLDVCPIYNRHILPDKILNLSSFHLENVQARDRGSRILSALASAWGGVFPNNGNKSEISVGYCTFYGDLSGFLATIGDLWKEQVYALGRHLNEKYHLLPEEVFTVHASAELSSDHDVDKNKGDPLIFWYHDRLFQSWMQGWIRVTPEENLEWYINGTINEKLHIPEGKSVYDLYPTKKEFCDDIERWYKAFKGLAVVKRVQAPPILAVSRRAYGFDYRETIGGFYLTRRYLELKNSKI